MPLGSAASAFPASAPVSEPAWSAWANRLPELDLHGIAVRVASVIAPHPDDETLGCGGLLHDLTARGVEVRVVTVTDGEASHTGWSDLAGVRRREQRTALDRLGITDVPTCLGLPDGQVADHEAELSAALVTLLAGIDLVLAPWESDGHTDHDAVGRVARSVGVGQGAVVLAHPVWAWQWATPADLAEAPWRRVTLGKGAVRAKSDAMGAYRSQLSNDHGPAVLDAEVVGRAGRAWEVYARV